MEELDDWGYSMGCGGWTASMVEEHRSHIYKRYLEQLNSLAIRDDMLGRHWKTADGKSKKAKTVLPKNALQEPHGGSARRHLWEPTQTLNKVRHR
jgi:hypothetical protein